MLKRLHVRNFTVFEEADFEFSPGLNVVVGTNGTGKSHVLKLGYIAARVTARIINDDILALGPENWRSYLAQRLKDVLQPVEVGKLVRWNAEHSAAYVTAEFESTLSENLSFNFSSSAKKNSADSDKIINVDDFPKETTIHRAVFIPPKEVLTLAWITDIYEKRILPIDDTYPALLDLLKERPLRKPGETATQAMNILEQIVGGRTEIEGERYYVTSEARKTEVNLIAEGVRKFAILEKLLRNGVLIPQNPLFWDEPEANLNPALLRQLAALLVQLAAQGFQIILATHSLFLMKEFHILAQQEPKAQVRYFGLSAAPGEATRVATADNLELLPDIVALDAELAQSDRFLHVLNQEDAGV